MCCQVGLVFVFNLIVGTGALAMPQAFAEAGWLTSLVMVALLALMRYVRARYARYVATNNAH